MKFTTFGAPSPRNVTLRKYTVHGGLQMKNGTLTLIDALFQEAYICASTGNAISRLQFKARGPNFHAELFPVHSPLLRESYLVSCPPLTYMLKFSGFADLTSCLEGKLQKELIWSRRGSATAQRKRHTGCLLSCSLQTLPVY